MAAAAGNLPEGQASRHFMMKCQSPEEWKTIVSTLQSLTEEAAFDIDSSGLKFRAMDPSHVALIDLVWEKDGFESFECSAKEGFVVRVEDFAKIIKRAERKDSVTISRDGSSSNALLIKLGGQRNFEFHLLERSAVSSVPFPKLSLISKFSIKREEFERALEDISTLANHVRIKTDTSGTLVLSGKGDPGSAKISFGKDELANFESPQESEAVYAVEYIQKVLKPASSSSEFIEFSFGTTMPLTASLSVGDPAKSKLKLAFFLAPRTTE
jgi:proliferating cell nuclear antigen